jgi:hypothetical protein
VVEGKKMQLEGVAVGVTHRAMLQKLGKAGPWILIGRIHHNSNAGRLPIHGQALSP